MGGADLLTLLQREAFYPGFSHRAIKTLMKANAFFPVEMILCTVLEAWSFWRPVWKKPDLKVKDHQLTFVEDVLCTRGYSHTIPPNPHQRVVSTYLPFTDEEIRAERGWGRVQLGAPPTHTLFPVQGHTGYGRQIMDLSADVCSRSS